APLLPTDNLPKSFDWREHGAMTPVKNQGSCGSCWTFSSTGAVEGAHFLKSRELISLREEQLVDCDRMDGGCKGGDMLNAYEYIKAKGLEAEEDYPYQEENYKEYMFPHHRCHFRPSKVAATIANYSTVSEDEDQIAANLVKNGPLSIALNANYIMDYMGGVACPRICPGGDNMNHAVLLVGYGMDGDKPYWILKNSWSENYGEDGYFRLCRGFGVCGMNTRVSTVSA
ncbi:hypothetical protein SELMODRAFT_110288, partial [Selaginella moellendorffii]